MKALRIYSLSLFLACTHILNAASLNLFDGQEPNNQEGEKFISIPEYNFKITRPFNTWKNRNPKSLNDDTCLLFSKSLLANTTFMIIAEQLGADFNWSIEDYRDLVVENLENVGTNLIINRDKERSIDGVKGRELSVSSQVLGQHINYYIWCGSHNGFFYQLHFIYPDKNPIQNLQDWKRLSNSFHILDKEAKAGIDNSIRVEDLDLPSWGLTTHLSEQSCLNWDAMETDFPESFAGALVGQFGAVAIVPIPYGEANVTFEDLCKSLLECSMWIEFPNERFSEPRQLSNGPAVGVGFTMEAEREGSAFLYDLRIFQQEGIAYLLAGWSDVSVQGGQERISDILDKAISIKEPVGKWEENIPASQYAASTATLLNHLGLSLYNRRQMDEALKLFRKAAAVDPSEQTYTENIIQALIDLGRYDEIVAFLQESSGIWQNNSLLRLQLAFSYSMLGDKQSAQVHFGALYDEDPYEDQDGLLQYINFLVEQENYDRSLKAIDTYIDKFHTTRAKIWKASILQLKGDFEQAAELLESMLKGPLYNSEAAYQLAEVFLESEQYTQALDIVEELEHRNYQNAYTQTLKGRAQLGLQWYPEAKESLEDAKKQDPANEEVSYLLDYVSSMLGEGTNSLVKNPIDPVPLPSPLNALMDELSTGSHPEAEDFGSEADFDVLIYNYNQGEQIRYTRYRQVRLLNTRGINQLSNIQFSFNPVYEAIYVNEAVVLDQDGKEVGKALPSQFYITDMPANGLATEEKLLNIPIPGLKTGYTLRYTVTREDYGNSDTFPFKEQFFASQEPLKYSIVAVSGDTENIAWQADDEIEHRESEELLLWFMKQPSVYVHEPWQARYQLYTPKLAMLEPEKSWEDIALDYQKDIKEKLLDNEAIASKAAELFDGLEDNETIIRAAINFVRNETTYQGIEFGVRACIPNTADQTLYNRYGDCKDHAVLLYKLLQQAHIPVELALINTGAQISDKLPSLDQFDHMINYLPDWKGGTFVDCTDKNQCYSLKVPDGLGEQEAFVLDPEKVYFQTLPSMAQSPSGAHTEKHIQFEEDGSFSLTERLTFTTYHAGWMRDFLKSTSASQYHVILQNAISPYSRLNLDDYKIINLDDNEAPLILELSYHHPAVAKQAAFAIPMTWEKYFMDVVYQNKRHTPFEIRYNIHFDGHVLIDQLPEGWTILPEGKNQQDLQYMKWALKRNYTGEQWEQDYRIDYLPGYHSAEAYSDFYQASDAGFNALSEL